MTTPRQKIDGFLRMVCELGPNSGVDVVPENVIAKFANEAGIDNSMAFIEFVDSCLRLHVDQWALGKTQDQYRRQHAARSGRVNIWATVLRHMPPAHDAARKEAGL